MLTPDDITKRRGSLPLRDGLQVLAQLVSNSEGSLLLQLFSVLGLPRRLNFEQFVCMFLRRSAGAV